MASNAQRRARALLSASEVVLAHAAAILVGPVLIVAGLGMTMSIVLLGFGLVALVTGILLLVWGLFGHLDTNRPRQVRPETGLVAGPTLPGRPP